MNRRLRDRAVTGAVLLLGAAFGGTVWAGRHLKRIRGADGEQVSCLSCHFSLGADPRRRRDGPSYPSPQDLALDPRGDRLFVTEPGLGDVAVLDLVRGTVERRLSVGRKPHGLAVSPDGRCLYVALRDEDRVVTVEVETGRELASAGVGRRPCGLALTPDGDTIVVANSGSDDVSLLEAEPLRERVRLAAGREPYCVACSADGHQAYVANRMSTVVGPREVPHAELTIVDLERGHITTRYALDSAHLSEGVAACASSGVALVPLVRVRNTVPILQVSRGWVMTSGVGVLIPGQDEVREMPLDDMNAYFADPAAVAVDDARQRAYVASGGGDCVSVLDLGRLVQLASESTGPGPGPWADHLGVSSEYVLARIPTGPNPRGLLLAPDGDRLFVAEHLGDSVAEVDTRTFEVTRRFALGGPSRRTPERRGEILFHRAAITFQGQFSCRSCHPDGHVDGLVYDFAIDGIGLNLLDNRSLLGIAETAPFKWNGKNKSLQDQCGPRFAKVLTMSDPFPEADLDSLVAYIKSLTLPPRDSDSGPAAERGRRIFERTRTHDGREIPVEQRCTTCHVPPLYTNRLLAGVDTRTPTDSGDRFDVPHLVGIADSAPYLHDGRARSLEEIWTVYSPNNTHGVVNDLSKSELNDMVEFLKSL